MFLYPSRLPENPTFAPSYAGEQEKKAAGAALWDATRELQLYRDNTGAEDNALAEAYERRNRAIFEASGIQLPNPRRDFGEQELQEAARRMDSGQDPYSVMEEREAAWLRRAQELARDRPELAGIIAADRPIAEDAAEIARGAERDMAAAEQRAEAAGVGTARKIGNILGGGVAGMIRDPLQVAALFAGGGIAAPARTVIGRVVQRVLTEAAINGGIEAGVQAASNEWKQKAGVDASLPTALSQVGLAALFGGGFGGLLAGGAEVFRLLNRQAPEALTRIGKGEAQPGDVAAVAEALGKPLDEETARVVDLAAEQHVMDAEAFGPPPPDMPGEVAEAMAVRAVREAEDPPDFLPTSQLRDQQVDRIVKSEFPLGPEPRRPVTLMQFLASRSVGGIREEGGHLEYLGLTKKFIPGGGALVRKNGKSLDYAREAAAEAGFFDDLYGDPERAVAESTVDDLLRALERERDGEVLTAPRLDGGRVFDWMEYQARQAQQAAYRRVLEEVSGAIDQLGIDHQLDDAILRRAAELVDDETDPVMALERAIDEDYRNYADALSERGEEPVDAADIPFFDDWQDAGTVPGAGGAARGAGAEGGPGGRAADAPDSGQLPRPGAGEEAPLRRPGDTPEPGTDQAVAEAEAVLVEARGPDTEATDAGEQTLLEGVKPVSTKERLEAQAAKPLRGGEAAPPAGGLFDLEAQKQIDIWDAMPAVKQADGTVLHATYASMVEDAERTGYLSDVVRFCQD